MNELRIDGAIDMHCHFDPDTIGGSLDITTMGGVTAIEAAREAHASGHAALVLKSHSFASPALAATMTALVPGLAVFGGVCTDLPSGGLNVAAVEAALALGARIVWLPTVHSYQDVTLNRRRRADGGGLRVIDDEGAPLEVVREIVDLIRQTDAILATGHISAEEHHAVAKAFAADVKVLVTHAGEAVGGPHLSAAQCAELADLGATIELTALACHDLFDTRGKSPGEMAAMIGVIGPGRCTLSTDYGWSDTLPRPAPGLRSFLEALWQQGLSELDLTTMVATNPARLLGLASR
jgi:hypothetical protein